MPHYMVQACFSKSSLKALMGSNQDRETVLRQAVEDSGGKLHHLYYSLGEFDVVTIQEWPDAQGVASFAVAVGSTDAVTRTMTTPLFTSSEGAKLMNAAKSVHYNPPH
jgi:uncharacterized protein with GYD domain